MEFFVKNFRWLEYGLSDGNNPDNSFDPNDPHDQVCRYLDSHPEIQESYKLRKQGYLYLDILDKVENKLGRKLSREG